MPDSPNPNPTQEVRRFNPDGNGMAKKSDGRWVTYEDHQRLLQAVEEERDREAALRVDAYRYQEAAEDLLNPEQKRAAAAESKLEEVAQELERRIEGGRLHPLARNEILGAVRLLRDNAGRLDSQEGERER